MILRQYFGSINSWPWLMGDIMCAHMIAIFVGTRSEVEELHVRRQKAKQCKSKERTVQKQGKTVQKGSKKTFAKESGVQSRRRSKRKGGRARERARERAS